MVKTAKSLTVWDYLLWFCEQHLSQPEGHHMTTLSPRCRLSLLLLVAVVASPSLVIADDLEVIKFGEAALSYASGGIQRSTPQDGVVNVITGDNQTTGDHMQLGPGDTLYIKLKNPSDVAVGDLYSVFKRTRKVFHPMTGEYLGYLVTRLAIVQVTQVDKALTTVQAIRAYGPVSPGDPVVKFALPADDGAASDQALAPDARGMIIELQANMGLTLVAQRNVVYVDRGREDGVRSGDQFEVIRSGGNLPPRIVGEIKVLFAEAKSASALITRSTARLFKGDRIRVKGRGPEVVPVSQPPLRQSELQPASESPAAAEAIPQENKPALRVQQASKETKITLNDLMKQLRYESGEATIKPEGYQVLDELVEYLRHAPVDQLIRVEGHADNMEIGPSLRSFFPTNWDLSKARATGVLRYLVEKGGIDSARISSVGYGDTKPVVSNATEVGRQKNRRVDIVLYSPETLNDVPERVNRQAAVRSGGFEANVPGTDSQMVTPPAVSSSDQAIGPPPSDSVPTDSMGGPSTGDQAGSESSPDRPVVP